MSKCPLERDFLDIYQTTFSKSLISEIQNLWGSSCFPKYLKFNLDFKNAYKNWQNYFCFPENCGWIGIFKLSLLRTRYFSSTASLITNSPKVLHVNKRDFFQLNWLGRDQWIWQICCDSDFNCAWARLPCCFSKGPLKPIFLGIYLTTFSESVISKMQNLWGSSFVSKYLKLNLDFVNEPKIEKKIVFSEIIASELVSLNCLY